MFIPSTTKPWLTYWTQPRSTISILKNSKETRHWDLIIIAYGIIEFFNKSQTKSVGEYITNFPILILTGIIGGALAGYFRVWLWSWLLHLTGKWIGGIATRQHLRTAFVWSSLPTLTLAVFWIPFLFIHGEAFFKKGYVILAPYLVLDYTFAAVAFVAVAWKFILLLKSISEVQGFSIWKALLNLTFPIIIACAFFIPLAIVIGMIVK